MTRLFLILFALFVLAAVFVPAPVVAQELTAGTVEDGFTFREGFWWDANKLPYTRQKVVMPGSYYQSRGYYYQSPSTYYWSYSRVPVAYKEKIVYKDKVIYPPAPPACYPASAAR